MKKHPFFIVSAPPGSGKTTLMREACGNGVISYTTRPRRQEEEHGVHYYFVSKGEFKQLQEQKKFVQVKQFGDYAYGITLDEINYRRRISPAYAIVSVEGMRQLKKKIPNSITIFIDCSLEDCILNMRDRGDHETEIERRIKVYSTERKSMEVYDYVVVNKRGQKDQAIKQLAKIINQQKRRLM